MKISPSSQIAIILILLQHTYGMSLPTASPAEEVEGYQYTDIDPNFSLNPASLHVLEMAKTLQIISGAVMGTAEIAIGIKSDLKLLRKEIMTGKMNTRFDGRQHPDIAIVTSEDRIRHNLVLAERIEKILGVENNTQVDLAKQEIQKIIKVNFVRVLAAMLINDQGYFHKRRDDILTLMKSVLNGELDFKPVVEKLPFILRESETNQFINLIQTIKEGEFPKIKGRQDDEDEDGDDDSQTLAPAVIAPAAAPEVQETVILVARPQQTQATGGQQQGTLVSSNSQNINRVTNSGVTTLGRPSIDMTPSAMAATAAPVRIVVRQPQAQPPATTKPPKSQLNKVIDAVGQFDVNQFQTLLSTLPDLFAGIDAIVDGVEGFIGE